MSSDVRSMVRRALGPEVSDYAVRSVAHWFRLVPNPEEKSIQKYYAVMKPFIANAEREAKAREGAAL